MSPIVIVGGGIAGAAVAAGLARAGRDVTIVEREAGPADKICGEFLSAEAQDYLRNLGLNLADLGGHRISELNLVRGDVQVRAELPFTGIGVSRRTLDEAILTHAARCGAKVLRGHRVTSVTSDDGLSVHLSGMNPLRPETVFLATGKHELRGLLRNTGSPNNLVGFKMYFRLATEAEKRLAGKVSLILFPRGYAGFQLVEGEKANLCLLTERSHLQDVGGDWATLLTNLMGQNSYLNQFLENAEALLAKALSIYRVPYGFVHQAAPSDPAQLYRLGDQAAVIPSFTGDGMAIALHSAALAVSCFLAGETAFVYHQKLSADISGQIRRASQLYSLAQSGITQPTLFWLAKRWPGSLGFAASLTRVPLRVRV